MADALKDYTYNKSADATSLNSASLTGFPAFVRLEEGTDSTGTGAGVLDSSASIDGKEDIGFFNESGTSLTYYWVIFDTTNGVYKAWVLTDLVRDGGQDLQVGYGSGSTDDSGTESGLWDSVPDLEARYSFEDDTTLLDSTSNNHDETSAVGPTSRSAEGQFGADGYDFDGSNDKISKDEVHTDSDWNFNGTSSMTAMMWYQLDTLDSSYEGFMSQWGSNGTVFQLVTNNNHDSYRFIFSDGSSHYPIVGGTPPTDGSTWTHHAGTYDGSTQRLFADGSQVNSQSVSITLNTSTETLRFGVDIDSNFMDGRADEAHIYNADKGQKWIKSHYDMSPRAGYALFSWNASEKTATVSNSLKATASGGGTQASNTASSTSSSSKAQVTGGGTQASNFSKATSNSDYVGVSATPLVASNSIVSAPAIKYRKPRARVRLIESENGTEHTLISTDDGSHNYLQGDISIDSSVDDAVDTFEFTLSNPNDRFSYISADDEVVIEMGYNTPLVEVFRGKVTKPQKNFGDDGSKVNISGQDFGQILQARKAAEVYLDDSVQFILKDLINKYASELDPSGIQGPGVTIKSKRIAYDSIFDVIEEFADRFNYQFYVDNDKVVHFEPKGFDASDHVFKEGEQILDFETQPNKEKLINEAIIFGGSQNVKEQEKKSGDGSKTVFTTTFKPHDPDVFVDGNHLQGGVAGTNSLGESDYLYDTDKKEFEFDVAPSDGVENIEIRYSRTIPIQAIVRDQESIDEYGLSQYQDTDQNINKQDEAKDIAQSLVDDFSQPPEEASAEIVAVHELTAGQSATFDVPSVGVDSRIYDIVSISYTWGDSGYKMSMNLNEEPRKLKDILKSLKNDVKTTKGFDSGILDLIRKIQTYSDKMSMGEALDLDSRQINDSFILGHSENSELGKNKGNPLGDRRGSYNDRVTK